MMLVVSVSGEVCVCGGAFHLYTKHIQHTNTAQVRALALSATRSPSGSLLMQLHPHHILVEASIHFSLDSFCFPPLYPP